MGTTGNYEGLGRKGTKRTAEYSPAEPKSMRTSPLDAQPLAVRSRVHAPLHHRHHRHHRRAALRTPQAFLSASWTGPPLA